MLVNDVSLELRSRDGVAAAELQVLDEQAGAVEGLLTADAS